MKSLLGHSVNGTPDLTTLEGTDELFGVCQELVETLGKYINYFMLSFYTYLN